LFNLGDFYMKKTLVALAVIAASSASFAQVTITGKLGFSYDKGPDAAARSHGMSMADGDVVFGASEDLGGGMKIDASSAVQLRGRTTGVAGRNATLGLTTGVGKFTFGAVESCSKIDNVAGAPVSLAYAQDNGGLGGGAPLDACANLDIAAYNVPVGPVTLGVAYIDSVGAAGAGAGAPFTANQVTLGYAAGALGLGLDHTVFAHGASALFDGLARTRLTVSYDLGMAKVGFGHQTTNHDKAAQTTFSVAVPMGAATVGLAYASRAAQSASAAYGFARAEDSRSSTAIGVDYALSKLTTVNVSWANYSVNKAQTGIDLDNEYRIRLMKAF
jgi:predicted porin